MKEKTCLAAVLALFVGACGGDSDDPPQGGVDASSAIDAATSGIDASLNPAAIDCAFPSTVSFNRFLSVCDLALATCRTYAPVVFPTLLCEDTDDGLSLQFNRDAIDSDIIVDARGTWTFVSTDVGAIVNDTRLQTLMDDVETTVVLDDGTGAQYQMVFTPDEDGAITFTSLTAL